MLALVMEFVATALNAMQGLIKGQRLLTLLRTSPGAGEVLAAFEHLMAGLPWAVYDVRRTLSPRADGKINHARSVRIFDIGDPAAMYARLDERARLASVPHDRWRRAVSQRHPRAWLRRREPLLLADGKTAAEQFLFAGDEANWPPSSSGRSSRPSPNSAIGIAPTRLPARDRQFATSHSSPLGG